MSEISELAKRLEANASSKSANNIKRTLDNDMKKIGDDISERLKQQQSATNKAIDDHYESLRTRIRRAKIGDLTYSWLVGVVSALAVLAVGVLLVAAMNWWQMRQLHSVNQQIAVAEGTLKALNDKTHNVKITRCTMSDGTSRYCAKIDPKYAEQTWGTEKKIMKILAQ